MTVSARGGENAVSVLVLSPHRDDAAFSCGLLLAALVSREVPVRIANICTVSDYAPYASLTGAADPVTEITRLRAEEDDAFVQQLTCGFSRGQAGVQLFNLGWKDAPLRKAIATEEVLVDSAVPVEEIALLAAAFRLMAAASVVLVPIALGGHLDHRLVRQAAIDAWPQDELVFYEDLPYACRMSPEERVEQTRRALPWTCVPGKTMPARSGEKRRLALCYRSQIAAAVADEIEHYGVALGGSERLYGSTAAMRVLAALSGFKETVVDR